MPHLLEVDDLHKEFGETRALRGCSFACDAGTVHSLVGENGSGKSTLVKILSGIITPDAGTVRLEGNPLHTFRPSVARALGIAPVLQEVLAIERRSVLENIFIGYDGLFRHRISDQAKRDVADAALGCISAGAPPSLDAQIEDLTLAERQIVVIARAFVQKPRVLILDEATSALDVSSRDLVFEEIRHFTQGGGVVIFISHRMDEVLEISDHITVLCDGQSVRSVPRGEADVEALLQMMRSSSGQRADRDSETAKSDHQPGPQPQRAGAGSNPRPERPVLRATGLRLRPGRPPFDFEIFPGEIVGVAGLEGHGQAEFIRALVGLSKPIGGTICVRSLGDGEYRQVSNLRAAARERVAYLPRDRKSQGVMGTLSILDNFGLPTLDRAALGGFVRQRLLRSRYERFSAPLAVVSRGPRALITTLSGGNQQKILLARWLALEPRALMLDDPTRGVDAATKRSLYSAFQELARQGSALVLLSTEIVELVLLCDRVIVFRDGAPFQTLERAELATDRVIAAMFGRTNGR
jgi:ABC-type sugar transport system ATPase subunit